MNKLPVRKKIYYADIVEAVTGSRPMNKTLKSLIPAFFTLAVGSVILGATTNALKEAGVIKLAEVKNGN